MFNHSAYENSRPDGIGVLEILPPTLPEPPDPPDPPAPRQFVPLRRTELLGEVAGPLASLCLVQTYGYTHEQCGQVLEARYRFPLPGDAAVTGVRVRFGEVEIQAELKERERAEADYEAAKSQGRQAALATREAPDVFTLQVAGLMPDQEVRIETYYVQLARTEGEGWTLRVPLTTAPRYVRADEAATRQAEAQPLLVLRDPGHRFSLDLAFRGAGAVTSPTHALQLSEEGDLQQVRLQDGEVLPDRDCVLQWQPRQEKESPALQVFLHDDRYDDASPGHVYFLALLVPPASPAPARVAREVILLVDHSGSMGGAKWEAADWAVKQFLASLGEDDSFNLGLFHTTTRWLSAAPRAADAKTLREAREFLGNRDSGGTELGVALEQALRQKRAPGEPARHVLIVTDAQVTDEGRLLRLADAEAKRAGRRRISLLCIDAAPNSFLALELAERGAGEARFLTSSPDEEDITTALDQIIAAWNAPLLANLRLEVSRPHLDPAGREHLSAGEGWSGMDLGDLPAGRSAWAAGRVPRGDSADLSFRVSTGERRVAACRLPLSREAAAGRALKALFGARRVLGLEYLLTSGLSGDALRDQFARLGYDPAVDLAGPGAVYAENAFRDAGKALRALLVREALEYGLASSETAFAAVRTEAGKPVEGSVDVANALPAGWSEQFASVPVFLRAGGARHRAISSSGSYAGSAGSPRSASPSSMGRPNSLAQSVGPPDPVQDAAAATPYASTLGAAFGSMALDFLGHGADDPEQVAEKFLVADGPPALYSGAPALASGEALLFDSERPEDEARLPKVAAFSKLRIGFPRGVPDPDTLDPNLTLLLFVDDLASPRARVRLADLVRLGGERPLNVAYRAGQRVRLVLTDPAGAWTAGAPEIEVNLE